MSTAQTEAENLARKLLEKQEELRSKGATKPESHKINFPDDVTYIKSAPDSSSTSTQSAASSDNTSSTSNTEGPMSSMLNQHRLQLLLAQYKILQSEAELARLREAKLRQRIEGSESRGRKRDLLLIITGLVIALQGLWTSSELRKRQLQVDHTQKMAEQSIKDATEVLDLLSASLPTIAGVVKGATENDKRTQALVQIGELNTLRERMHTQRVNAVTQAPK